MHEIISIKGKKIAVGRLTMLKRFFDYFLFTSVFIALCAVIMVFQTVDLLQAKGLHTDYFYFVFFSTLSSYNFHWFLTPDSPDENMRVSWTQQHKTLHLLIFIAGTLGAVFFGLRLLPYFLWLSIGALLTFLYSAPKINLPPFSYLKKIAVGKTIFLAIVWTYVTSLLPLIIAPGSLSFAGVLFAISRFFLIYAICIIFDYRDRTYDKLVGIRSLITLFSERGINILFYLSLALFAFSTAALAFNGLSWLTVCLLLVPGVITLSLYRFSKLNFSDYLYYFVLDGLMMFSAIFTSLI